MVSLALDYNGILTSWNGGNIFAGEDEARCGGGATSCCDEMDLDMMATAGGVPSAGSGAAAGLPTFDAADILSFYGSNGNSSGGGQHAAGACGSNADKYTDCDRQMDLFSSLFSPAEMGLSLMPMVKSEPNSHAVPCGPASPRAPGDSSTSSCSSGGEGGGGFGAPAVQGLCRPVAGGAWTAGSPLQQSHSAHNLHVVPTNVFPSDDNASAGAADSSSNAAKASRCLPVPGLTVPVKAEPGLLPVSELGPIMAPVPSPSPSASLASDAAVVPDMSPTASPSRSGSLATPTTSSALSNCSSLPQPPLLPQAQQQAQQAAAQAPAQPGQPQEQNQQQTAAPSIPSAAGATLSLLPPAGFAPKATGTEAAAAGAAPAAPEGHFRTRKECLERYREKKSRRLYTKKIRYQLRKINADKRPRIKGRFVKKEGGAADDVAADKPAGGAAAPGARGAAVPPARLAADGGMMFEEEEDADLEGIFGNLEDYDIESDA